MKILFVEDEKYIARAVAQTLKHNNYSVDLAQDGEYGLDCALSGVYDIIILDIMLPKKDGISVLKELRRSGIHTPVLLLTARGQTADKVNGLDSGADDYLAKPFESDELLARLRALGRRKSGLNDGGILRLGKTELNPHSLMLTHKNKTLRLTLKEAQMLELLLHNRRRVVSKEAMIEKLWGYDSEAEDSHVEYHISQLRKRLAEIKSEAVISTVRGAGYTIEEDKSNV